MSVLPKLSYRFNAITIKIQARCFVDIDKLILTLMWRDKRPSVSNSILKERSRVIVLELPNFKPCPKPTVIKTL